MPGHFLHKTLFSCVTVAAYQRRRHCGMCREKGVYAIPYPLPLMLFGHCSDCFPKAASLRCLQGEAFIKGASAHSSATGPLAQQVEQGATNNGLKMIKASWGYTHKISDKLISILYIKDIKN